MIYIHACYKLFNYIQRIWSHSSFLYQLILYQHVYWLIFVLVRRIFCNMIAVHITNLFLFLNLSKGSLEVSEYQLSFGPSSCHPCRPFIFIEPHHYFTMVYWNKKKKRNICTIRLTSTSTFTMYASQIFAAINAHRAIRLKVSICKQMKIYWN